jgi:hypothetical protein
MGKPSTLPSIVATVLHGYSAGKLYPRVIRQGWFIGKIAKPDGSIQAISIKGGNAWRSLWILKGWAISTLRS